MFAHKPVRKLKTALVFAAITRNKETKAKTVITDPVQQLFIDKIREYRSKVQPNVVFVEPSPAILKELEKELSKLDRAYGGGKGIDMLQFPDIKFPEPDLDSIDEEDPKKAEKGAKKGEDEKKKK